MFKRKFVLGIDPGICNLGWALMDENCNLIKCGCFRSDTKVGDELFRINYLVDQLVAAIATMRILGVILPEDEITYVAERVPFTTRVTHASILPLLMLVGALGRTFELKLIYASSVRSFYFGGGKVTKPNVIELVKFHFGIKTNHHVADAILLASFSLKR